MTKELQDYVVEKTNDLIAAQSCCPEAKAEAQAFLAALGTDKEAEETANYIQELEADIMPIDGVIEFAGSEKVAQMLGDKAKGFLEHAKQVKANGGKYCDCPACTACAAILEKKDQILFS